MIISRNSLKQIILEELVKELEQQGSDADLNKLFASIDSQVGTKLKSLANAPAPQAQAAPQKNIKQEGVITAIGLAAAIPKILSLASSAAGYFKFVKTAEQLQKASKYLHHKYLDVIKMVLQKFGGEKFKNAPPEKQKLVAELVFMAIVCVLMWSSAYQLGDALASTFTSMGIKTTLLEGLLTAIKGGEVIPFLVKNSEKILAVA